MNLSLLYAILYANMKSRLRFLPDSKIIISFFAVILFCIVLLVFSWSWMLRVSRNEKMKQTYEILVRTKNMVEISLDHVFKVSQMLLLDKTIGTFIYQGQIEAGSKDIQTIIDAKNQLLTTKNINALIAEIYIYSKASGYLLSPNNAYLQPEKMYSSLFAFEDLNYLQFVSHYLTVPQHKGFFAETTTLVNGRSTDVIPYIQTFPLNNPASNSGKILVLLDRDVFCAMLTEQFGPLKISVYAADTSGKLVSWCGSPARFEHLDYPDGQYVLTIDGKKQVLSIVSSTLTGLRFYSLLSLKDIHTMATPLWNVFTIVSLVVFMLTSGFALGVLCVSHSKYKKAFNVPSQNNQAVIVSQVSDTESDSETEKETDTDDLLVQKITAYIHGHYAETSLNLYSVAKDFGMKESFLYHFMQTRMQTSFAQYLENYRLEVAASLFAERQISVSEVSIQCGYVNPQTFRRAFKKRYGLLPSEYQKNMLLRQENEEDSSQLNKKHLKI